MLAYPAGGNKIALADLMARGKPKVIELPLPVAPPNPPFTSWSNRRQRLAWDSASPLLAVACTNAIGKATILFWDTDRQAEQARWDGNFDIKALVMAFSPSGKRLAAGDAARSIRLYDLAAQSEALRLETAQPGGIGMLRWLPDGRLLSADDFGNSFTAWEPAGTLPASVLVSGKESIGDLAFIPEDRCLAVLHGGAQPAVALVECDSGHMRPSLPSQPT